MKPITLYNNLKINNEMRKQKVYLYVVNAEMHKAVHLVGNKLVFSHLN